MSEILLYALGVLLLALGLGVSIALHEIGHLVPAKRFGVKVTQYMIGFGRTVWSRRRGETEYGVKALPLGGYVAMIGMYPPAQPGAKVTAQSTGFFSSLSADAREQSAASIGPDDTGRAFYSLPVWQKIVIMLGGPVVNLLLGTLLFTILVSGIGLLGNSTTLGNVTECLKPATVATAQAECAEADPPSPGAAAGLQPGDRVLAVAGTGITDWEQFRNLIAANPSTPLQLKIERDGVEQTVVLEPQLTTRQKTDAAGNLLYDSAGAPEFEEVGMIGASPATERQPQPLTAVPQYVGEQVGAVVNVILHLPQRMVAVWNAAFSDAERDANGPISVVGVGRIAGEISSLDSVPVLDRAAGLLGLLASLNIALFVFNMVPLLPLDGGHIASALYEGARRKFAKLRGRPDPGPVDTAKFVPVTFAVIVVLGAMSLLLIYADIVKPVTLG